MNFLVFLRKSIYLELQKVKIVDQNDILQIKSKFTVMRYKIGVRIVAPSYTCDEIEGPNVNAIKKTRENSKIILKSQSPSLITLTCLVLDNKRANIKM
jgi:hypothetical protein